MFTFLFLTFDIIENLNSSVVYAGGVSIGFIQEQKEGESLC